MHDAYDSYEHAGAMVEIVHDDDPMSPQDNDNAGTLYSWTRGFDGDERIGTPDMEVLCPTCQGEALVPTRYWPGADWTGCLRCDGGGTVTVGLAAWFEEHYDAALTIPLWYDNYGSRGSRLYEDEDEPNCALCFTQKEIDYEWGGYVERKNDNNYGARSYAKGRIQELDNYLQGNVWGIVIREALATVGVTATSRRLRTFGTLADAERYVGTLPNAEDGIYYIDYPCPGEEVLESCWGFIDEPDGEYVRAEAKGMAEAVAASIRKEALEAAEWAARGVVTV